MEARLGILIEHLGLNQKEFAEQIGLTPGNITEWRKGRSAPTAKILKVLAEKYSISLNWLLTGTGSMLLTDTPAPDLPAEDAALLADVKQLVKAHSGGGECRECKELKQKIAELEERERKLIRENGNLEGKLELLQEQSVKHRGCSAG